MNRSLPEQIESERLILRVSRPGDGVVFNAAIRDSIDELSLWLDWVSPLPTLEDSEHLCRKLYGRFLLNEVLAMLVIRKECDSLVGGVSLHNIDWELRHFEVGYWGRTSFCGNGLITEAVVCLSDCALTELAASRVFLTTDERNVASWRLAVRAGFVFEGTLRNERFDLSGALRNTKVYARIPDDVKEDCAT